MLRVYPEVIGGFPARLYGGKSVLEGLTGGESDGGDAETAPAGVDPVASAVAMDAGKYDPLLANKVGDYLDRQAKLVAIQTEHLHEQREVILANLKLKRWGERIKIAIQIFFALGFSTSAAGDGL